MLVTYRFLLISFIISHVHFNRLNFIIFIYLLFNVLNRIRLNIVNQYNQSILWLSIRVMITIRNSLCEWAVFFSILMLKHSLENSILAIVELQINLIDFVIFFLFIISLVICIYLLLIYFIIWWEWLVIFHLPYSRAFDSLESLCVGYSLALVRFLSNILKLIIAIYELFLKNLNIKWFFRTFIIILLTHITVHFLWLSEKLLFLDYI
jgi:hypothetical protein